MRTYNTLQHRQRQKRLRLERSTEVSIKKSERFQTKTRVIKRT